MCPVALALAGCPPCDHDHDDPAPTSSGYTTIGGSSGEASSGEGRESTGDHGSTSTGGCGDTTSTGAHTTDDTTSTGAHTTGSDTTGGATGTVECEQGVAWVRVFPPKQPEHEIRGMAVDGAGNTAIIGDFMGSVDLGLGPMDEADGSLYVAKLGPDGSTLWVRQFGTTSMRARDIAFDDDGDIVVAAFYWLPFELGGDVLPKGDSGGPSSFVAKLTGDGEHVWSRGFVGSESVQVYTVDVAPGGEIVATFESYQPVDFGGGPIGATKNSFIVRLDPDGALAWARAFYPPQGPGSVYWPGAAFTPDGGIAVIVRADGMIEFGAGPVSLGSHDAIQVLRLSPTGALQWLVGTSSASIPFYAGVRTDAADRIHVAGSFAYSLSFGGPELLTDEKADAYAAVLAGDGSHLWSASYGAGALAAQGVTSLDVTADGRRALAGVYAGSIDFGDGETVAAPGQRDGFVAVQGPLGEPLWSRRFAGNGQFFAHEVALHEGGDVWLAGQFDEEFVVGDQVFVNGYLEYSPYVLRLCDPSKQE